MRKIIGLVILVLVLLGGYFFFQQDTLPVSEPSTPADMNDISAQEDVPRTTVIAENLDTPWGITFLPDGDMLVTERKGAIWRIDSSGESQPAIVGEIPEVTEISEGGLLGITLHPDFEENRYVYLYYTYRREGNETSNRVVRMTYAENQLTNQEIIIDAIPGAPNHDGGRLEFGPDDYLYITTGDAQNPSLAQDTDTLAGKILRVTPEGEPAPGNPFGNRVYSYGHRNPQGIAWGPDGELWATEHGRSGIQSGLDEINLIQPGQNYGWPEYQGDEAAEGTVPPARHSGPDTTWAPAGAAFAGNSLFFAGLRGRTLYEAVVSGDEVIEVREHFVDEYGRLRGVVQGTDGMLYISTSNRDGRGSPDPTDDRIIRVNPEQL